MGFNVRSKRPYLFRLVAHCSMDAGVGTLCRTALPEETDFTCEFCSCGTFGVKLDG